MSGNILKVILLIVLAMKKKNKFVVYGIFFVLISSAIFLTGCSQNTFFIPSYLNLSYYANLTLNNIFSGVNTFTNVTYFNDTVYINSWNETVLNLNVTGVTRFYNSTYNNSVDSIRDGWGIIPIGTWQYFEDSGKNLRRVIGVTTLGVIEIGNTPTVVITGIKMMAGTNGNVTIFNSTGEIFKITPNGNVTINGTLEIYKNVIRVWNGATSIQLTGNGLSWSSGDSVGSNLWSSTTASSIRNYDGTQYKTSLAFNNSRNANQPSVTVFSKNYTDRTKPIAVFWNDLRTELAGNLTVNGSEIINGSITVQGNVPTTVSCGTGANVTGSDSAGYVTVGSGAGSTCVVVYNHTWANIPVCVVNDATGRHPTGVSSTTINMTIEETIISGDKIGWICIGQ